MPQKVEAFIVLSFLSFFFFLKHVEAYKIPSYRKSPATRQAGPARYSAKKINNKEKEGEVSFEESFKIKSPRERENCDLVKR